MTKKPKTTFEQQIEDNLRRVYQRTLEQEVPDRFSILLQKLREQDQEQQEQNQ